MDEFRKKPIAVTLTYGEWFAIIAKMSGQRISSKGDADFARAAMSLEDQVRAASNLSDTEVLP